MLRLLAIFTKPRIVVTHEEFDQLKIEFESKGYRFCPKTSVTSVQFTKIFVFDNGIKYCLTWYVTTVPGDVLPWCGIYEPKHTYHCMMITGERIHITIESDVFDISDAEEKANQLYKTNLFKPFETFKTK